MSPKWIRTIGIGLLALVFLVSTSVLAAPYGSRTLYTGAFGGDVVELQRRLNSLGYVAGIPDGTFGRQTREAVIRFQRDYGLVPDGLAGTWTFRAVDRAYTWQHGFFYSVVRGDSLWGLSQRFGTTVPALTWLNRLNDPMLYPGQQLRVLGGGRYGPPVAPAPAPAPAPTKPPAPTPAPAPTKPPAPTPAPAPAKPPAPATPPAPTQPPAPTPPTAPDTVTSAPPAYPAPVPAQVPAGGYTVLAYYAEDWQGDTRALSSLKNLTEGVDLVVNFQMKLDAQGNVTTRPYPELMTAAANKQVKVHGLVHNYSGSGFDATSARAVLSTPEIRSKAVANMLAVAQQYGLSGLNIDLENVPPDQRQNYTALVQELAAVTRPQGLLLTLSIPAKTWDDTTSPWSGAFDYKALGQLADKIVPMAYDENLPGFQPGPVASIGWVEKVAAFAASQIPPEKVLLGVPAYAYDWQKGTTLGRALSVPAALELMLKYGATLRWDEPNAVPTFTYFNAGQERVVYFENARSLAPKLNIVRKYGLGGIGIWRLGLEDSAIWSVIGTYLK